MNVREWPGRSVAWALLLCATTVVSGPFEAAEPASSARVADVSEPGERLSLTGRVLSPRTDEPVAGAQLYVYQTDADGYYSPGTDSSANPRLKATVQTDDQGRFELHTIRPGSYPGSRVHQHIHFKLSAPGRGRTQGEIVFADDPLLSASRRQSPPAGWVVVEPSRGPDGRFLADVVLRVAR